MLEVAREHVARQGRGEVETKRGDDDEKTDRHRRPHAEDGTGTFQIHRLIRRMMASAGSPPASSRALRASSSETPAFSATNFTSSSGIVREIGRASCRERVSVVV